MIVDLSKIPSTCTFTLMTYSGSNPFICFLEEQIRGRTIKSQGSGKSPQEAVDNAIQEFTR